MSRVFLTSTGAEGVEELSLHILDIAKNSVAAKASLVTIILEHGPKGILKVVIRDNGCGMSAEFQKKVLDPFTTSRTTRKVGLGLPLYKMAAEQTGGSFSLESQEGEGTSVTAVFDTGSIDCMPLGDIAFTVATLVNGSPGIDFVFTERASGREYTLATAEMREILGGVPLDSPDVFIWITEFISDNHSELMKNA